MRQLQGSASAPADDRVSVRATGSVLATTGQIHGASVAKAITTIPMAAASATNNHGTPSYS